MGVGLNEFQSTKLDEDGEYIGVGCSKIVTAETVTRPKASLEVHGGSFADK